METNSKKKLGVFIIVAYVVTYLMGVFMYVGFKKEVDLSVFPIAQMMYPACGVLLGKLIYDKANENIPRKTFILILAGTGLFMILSIISVFAPLADTEVNGVPVAVYNLIAQYIIILVSIIVYFAFWKVGSDSRKAIGLERKNIKTSVIMVALFVCLYFARFVLACVIDGVLEGTGATPLVEWLGIFTTGQTWGGLITVAINFFFTWIIFFGEEYGWRYYLQPVMMNKFGKRAGVLLLGLVWGIWHLPLDFFYYTTTTGAQIFVNQLITCVSIGIFMAYAYMKTGNMWVPIILHYINNNLIPVFSNDYSNDVLENQSLEWNQLIYGLVLSLIFVVFIVSKEFNKDSVPQYEVEDEAPVAVAEAEESSEEA